MNNYLPIFILVFCLVGCEKNEPDPPVMQPPAEYSFLGFSNLLDAQEEFGNYALLGVRSNGVFGLSHKLNYPEGVRPFNYETVYQSEDIAEGIKPFIGYNIQTDEGEGKEYAGEYSINELQFEYSDCYWAEGVVIEDNAQAASFYEDYVNPLMNVEKRFMIQLTNGDLIDYYLDPVKRFLLSKTLTAPTNVLNNKIKISLSNPSIEWNDDNLNDNQVLFIINGTALLTADDGEFTIPNSITQELTVNEDISIQMIRGEVAVAGIDKIFRLYTLAEVNISGITVQ